MMILRMYNIFESIVKTDNFRFSFHLNLSFFFSSRFVKLCSGLGEKLSVTKKETAHNYFELPSSSSPRLCVFEPNYLVQFNAFIVIVVVIVFFLLSDSLIFYSEWCMKRVSVTSSAETELSLFFSCLALRPHSISIFWLLRMWSIKWNEKKTRCGFRFPVEY